MLIAVCADVPILVKMFDNIYRLLASRGREGIVLLNPFTPSIYRKAIATVDSDLLRWKISRIFEVGNSIVTRLVEFNPRVDGLDEFRRLIDMLYNVLYSMNIDNTIHILLDMFTIFTLDTVMSEELGTMYIIVRKESPIDRYVSLDVDFFKRLFSRGRREEFRDEQSLQLYAKLNISSIVEILERSQISSLVEQARTGRVVPVSGNVILVPSEDVCIDLISRSLG